jgi:molybdate transport system ATP-binding protein
VIDIDISLQQGAFRLDARFSSPQGVTALFGKSGSGKSSIVKAIAGLLRPERGSITVNGEVLFDSQRRINVPAVRRRAGIVFQDGRLFPHLTVHDNLLYGFKRARGKREIEPDRVIAVLGIRPLLSRRPMHLSGGERQRVAVGRALLMQPRVLLMDEPLASLDNERKQELLPFFGMLNDRFGIPILHVTHEPAEVFELAQHIVLLDKGHVTASGSLEEITAQLNLPAGAEALGFGAVVTGTISAHEQARGLTVISTGAGAFHVPMIDRPAGARVTLRINARDVAIAITRPEYISIQNIFEAAVDEVQATERQTVRIALRSGGCRLLSEVTQDSVARLGLKVGAKAFALVKAAAIVRNASTT